MSYPKIKTFYYEFMDPLFSGCVRIDVSKYPTIYDFRKVVASIFNILDYNLILKNPPDEKQLDELRENYTFQLIIKNRCTDVEFVFPNRQTILIEDCYKKDYFEIIKIFQKNHIFFSKKCIKKHIHFLVFGKELPHIEFPFFAIPLNSFINVQMSCDVIVLNYGENSFIFREFESADKAYKLIQKVYKNCHSVSILNEQNEKLNYCDELTNNERYQIQVLFMITFQNVGTNSELIQKVDYFSTVFDAQKILSKIYNRYEPENITIYDDDMNIIHNKELLLINIHSLDETFKFKIDFTANPPKNENDKKIEIKSYSKTPDRQYKPSPNTIDLDIVLKQPFFSRTPDIVSKNRSYQIIEPKFQRKLNDDYEDEYDTGSNLFYHTDSDEYSDDDDDDDDQYSSSQPLNLKIKMPLVFSNFDNSSSDESDVKHPPKKALNIKSIYDIYNEETDDEIKKYKKTKHVASNVNKSKPIIKKRQKTADDNSYSDNKDSSEDDHHNKYEMKRKQEKEKNQNKVKNKSTKSKHAKSTDDKVKSDKDHSSKIKNRPNKKLVDFEEEEEFDDHHHSNEKQRPTKIDHLNKLQKRDKIELVGKKKSNDNVSFEEEEEECHSNSTEIKVDLSVSNSSQVASNIYDEYYQKLDKIENKRKLGPQNDNKIKLYSDDEELFKSFEDQQEKKQSSLSSIFEEEEEELDDKDEQNNNNNENEIKDNKLENINLNDNDKSDVFEEEEED